MTASAYRDLSLPPSDGVIGFRPTAEQELVIRRAAELSGWSVTEYVLCAVLDRAEREVHEHAASVEWEYEPSPAAIEPLDSAVHLYGEL
jgi:uncharacterized protein (DUF1778 family)